MYRSCEDEWSVEMVLAQTPTHHLREGLLFLLANFCTEICEMGTKLLLSREGLEEQKKLREKARRLCLWVGWLVLVSVG